MRYRVIVQPSAQKVLDKLPVAMARRIAIAILALSDEPRPHGCKKLVGSDTWRIRVGDYRVIYDIDDDVLIVLVLKIAHRKDSYR